jgi:Sec-independent protein translocase protein TatA
MSRPDPVDFVIVLYVAALLVNVHRLPKAVRALGRGIREFRDALTGKDEARTNEKNHDTDSKRSAS